MTSVSRSRRVNIRAGPAPLSSIVRSSTIELQRPRLYASIASRASSAAYRCPKKKRPSERSQSVVAIPGQSSQGKSPEYTPGNEAGGKFAAGLLP